MSSETSQSTTLIQWHTWVLQNRKRLTAWGGAGGVAIVALVLLFVFQSRKEASATLALSSIEVPVNGGVVPEPSVAQEYLKVASQYAGTQAGGRALLLAGSVLFMHGNYVESQAKFEEFLKSYSDTPWVPQAMFGVAGALDAQKQTAAAIEKYEDIRRRFATAPVAEEARLCLGRLFEQENRNEEAFAIYDELVRTHPSSGLGAEAGLRREDLVARFPDLAKTNALPAATSLTPTPALPPSPAPGNQPTITITTNIAPVPPAVTPAIPNATQAASNAPLSIQLPPAPQTPAPNAPPPTPAPSPNPNPAPPAPAPAPAPNPAPAPPNP